MQRTRIKICGICRPQDALTAAAAGADAIGMVFHPPSRRCITMQTAREVLAILPPFVTPVALFVDAGADEVRTKCVALGVRHVQLHGDESPELIAELTGFIVIKAVRVEPQTFGAALHRWRAAIHALRLTQLRGLLLETAAPVAGGSGIPNDWDSIIRHKESGAFDGLPPLIAAGGLTPESVAGVVQRVHPWAVDVSSGVEEIPGGKSAEKIAAFVAAVSDADHSF